MNQANQYPLSILSKIILFCFVATTTLLAQNEQTQRTEQPTTTLPKKGFTGHVMFGMAHLGGDITTYLPQNQFVFGIEGGYIYKNVVITSVFHGTGDYDLKHNLELKGRTWGIESGAGVFTLQFSSGYQLRLAKRWLATPFIGYNRTILEIKERLVGNQYYETPSTTLTNANFSGGVNVDWILKNALVSPIKKKNKDWHVLSALRMRVEYNPRFSLPYNSLLLNNKMLNISLGLTTIFGRNQ
ncbi:MAG: hypothetical protein U5L45_10580 [Saprospiraceae bacterium]|nr:hypothetical protein [Saprospiraceae bacterium]